MSGARILLVDDEREISQLVQIVLRKEGFTEVALAFDGQEALRLVQELKPHIIVLDVMLPDANGFDLCREIRRQSDAPILFLTARTSDLDKLSGFSAGGDDYVTKPFNPLEIAARIKALCRRLKLGRNQAEHGRTHDFGRFQVNEEAGVLMVAGKEVACPAMEFKLLAYLCAHPNRVFSKAQLYEQIWGEASLGDDNTVMVHIRRLREKIEVDPSKPEWIVTVRGLGYKLMAPRKG
ncbi:response regulator transcription factor [Laceyella putida]|uniref:Response regulator transcription factor n=1 Tax=Laceyella putida TaxID=110101 RepID=A0ABW2RFX4_9BACL